MRSKKSMIASKLIKRSSWSNSSITRSQYMKWNKISTALRAHSLSLPLASLTVKILGEAVHLKDRNLKKEQDRAMKGLFKKKLSNMRSHMMHLLVDLRGYQKISRINLKSLTSTPSKCRTILLKSLRCLTSILRRELKLTHLWKKVNQWHFQQILTIKNLSKIQIYLN